MWDDTPPFSPAPFVRCLHRVGGCYTIRYMDTRTTAAVGGIGMLAFMLVGIGLWHVAGVLDSMTNADVSVALQAASSTTGSQITEEGPVPPLLPRVPRRIGTGAVSASAGSEKIVSAPVTVAGVGTLDNLLTYKSDLTCAVTTLGTALPRTGTVYLSDGDLRGDFNITVDGRSLHSSMIDAGGYLYAWMDAGTHGVRLLAASSVSGSAIVSYGGVNPVQEISYSCNLWKAGHTQFAPPSSIAFTDTAGN